MHLVQHQKAAVCFFCKRVLGTGCPKKCVRTIPERLDQSWITTRADSSEKYPLFLGPQERRVLAASFL